MGSFETMQIYKDSEDPLLSVSLNHKTKELVFGSRKVVLYERNHLVTIKHKFGRYIHLEKRKNKIRIRSRKNGKYLRMIRKGTVLDMEGTDDPRETANIFKWNIKKKPIQSVKHKDCYVAIRKKDNMVIPIKEKKITNKVCVQFELVDTEKNKKFDSFFDFLPEPPYYLFFVL